MLMAGTRIFFFFRVLRFLISSRLLPSPLLRALLLLLALLGLPLGWHSVTTSLVVTSTGI